MKHIQVVDIRGNRVGDPGVIALVKGLNHLKSLMISETGCGNISARAIFESLKNLEILWAEHNNIDDEHCI